MVKHYWVTTPEITHSYLEEPPETYAIWRGIAATSQAKAKGEFIRQERIKFGNRGMDQDNWLYNVGYGDNPFVGLHVVSAMCIHGVCNCEIEDCDLGKGQDPRYDYCGDCIKEDSAEKATKALSDFMTGKDPKTAEYYWRQYVEDLLAAVPEENLMDNGRNNG